MISNNIPKGVEEDVAAEEVEVAVVAVDEELHHRRRQLLQNPN